jgi:hypothetical protein
MIANIEGRPKASVRERGLLALPESILASSP